MVVEGVANWMFLVMSSELRSGLNNYVATPCSHGSDNLPEMARSGVISCLAGVEMFIAILSPNSRQLAPL
jgi:hypothetical protein